MERLQPNPDRRIAKTRQIIYETFISLISEKEFTQISIKDITHQANISRSTFYSHYQDKYDLLDKTIQEKLSELNELLMKSKSDYMNYESNIDIPDPYFVTFFEHLAKNNKFYHIMFTKMDSSEFLSKMFEVIRESFYIRVSSMEKDQKLLVPLEILLDYSSSSILGITKVWVESNMIYASHYMALQLTRLAIMGLYKTMGKMN
ncbi:TetR/AcrR family transcriptional regulator [Bacillus salipaludis]|uniref:TetR/AcrR family transcriptional regulator n=1 Tax=Bacillus salipaludis TaxID=2547811 RepID=UPI002E23054C|nr:TetR/AcrR family transcriptional regulator C-terminal domain-containing protein [Bacillus salipaludis]